MNRDKKLKYNTLAALVNQIITIVCGFILPRFFLKCYGSQVYGLISSISQFLGFVTLMELGMGAVVQSTLYKPLARKDKKEISKIIKSATSFFNKIAIIFAAYTILLAFIYPTFIRKEFEFWFEASLILIISIGSLAEYFFGITYKLLLTADQMSYIPLGLQSVGLIANFAICVLLMRFGASIHVVKLASSLVLLFRPIVQIIYVNRKYDIDKTITYSEEPIKQKWNGIAQHIAYYVTNNTDTIVLSFLSTLENVSIYSVYNMVTNGIKQLVLTLNSGMQALFGNMLANNELEELRIRFNKFEWEIHTIVTLLFSCVMVLIVPFVRVYTKGINDANYIQPLFAFLMTLAQMSYCFRIPYNTLVCAAGHYKQTQMSAIIEMVLNLSITIVLVSQFGLVGVAIGTLVAMVYRTIYLVVYLSKNVIGYSISYFVKNIIIDVIEVATIVIVTILIPKDCNNYFEWILLACEVFGAAFVVIIIANFFAYRNHTVSFLKKIIKRIKRK